MIEEEMVRWHHQLNGHVGKPQVDGNVSGAGTSQCCHRLKSEVMETWNESCGEGYFDLNCDFQCIQSSPSNHSRK